MEGEVCISSEIGYIKTTLGRILAVSCFLSVSDHFGKRKIMKISISNKMSTFQNFYGFKMSTIQNVHSFKTSTISKRL